MFPGKVPTAVVYKLDVLLLVPGRGSRRLGLNPVEFPLASYPAAPIRPGHFRRPLQCCANFLPGPLGGGLVSTHTMHDRSCCSKMASTYGWAMKSDSMVTAPTWAL